MPLTPAEKMQRYRERLKENPEKYEEQRKKNLRRLKSKYKYKKITELTDNEKEIQRKKWREQKKKTSKDTPAPAVDVIIPIINEQRSDEIKQMRTTIKRITRGRDRYRNNLNYANSRIAYYKRLTENLRKKIQRMKSEHTKMEEHLKARNEVLEVSLKNAYKQCASYKEKDVFKTITNDEAVKENRAKSAVGQALGLKGRIRKTQKTIKVPKLQPSIVKFFLRDDITRATAGKRECRTKNKKKRQIRLLNNTLQGLYTKYKKEGGLASFTTFCKYKPFYILGPTLKNCNTCLCVKHSNINFKFNALKRAGVFNHKDMTALLESVVCDINKYECMYEKCKNCKSKSLPYNSEQYVPSEEISWLMWELVDHKYNKKSAEGPTR
ncbi:uncharacterized protein LOC125236153 [Leguminivora glycinivorella]|uniref:uncharacterized protein LOC125236153 n=1 Tax=Leguminivora glycinivorella TaxID=1035111 RepID=UPI00200ED904|nr:uncharacterized protein LOC125236153 [Leguminivora glycinivorella]